MEQLVGLQQTVSDTSELTGLPSFAGFISSSVQISSSISGSFTSGLKGGNNKWFINFNRFFWKSRWYKFYHW